MKDLAMIACVSADLGLGKDNQLLWHLKNDMEFFRRTTTNHPVIMGKNTYSSIGRPLPNRQNIVLTRGEVTGDVTVCHSKTELDQLLQTLSGQKFIIGGASLYEMYLDTADTLYLTEVSATKPADTFFPSFDKTKYSSKIIATGDENQVSYRIIEYKRKES